MSRSSRTPGLPVGNATLVVLIGYGLSRVFYAGLGVAPDLTTLPYFWQYLDLDLLRHDLWRSVFYDHAQPPLFNLWLGMHLKLADGLGVDPSRVFQLSVWCVGAAMHVGVFGLACRLGASRAAGVIVAVLWAFSPASVLYEHWVFYSAPIATLLLGVFVFGHRALSTARRRDYIYCFLCAAGVLLGRSLFHLVWMLAIVLTVVAFSRLRRRAIVCALVPFLLATSVYAKNLALYDHPVSSTWLGMSFAKLAVIEAPTALKRRLRAEGRLSALSSIPPFAELRYYPAPWREVPEGTPDHRSVRESMRSTGHPNYHHAAYIPIADAYMSDARTLLDVYPHTYLNNLRTSAQIFWKSTARNSFLEANRLKLEPIDRAYDALWGVPSALGTDEMRARWAHKSSTDVAWGWLLAVILVSLWGTRLVFTRRRANAALRGTVALVLGTLLYVLTVSTLVEVGENNRFRFLIEPACLALVAAGWSTWTRRLSRHRPPRHATLP